MKEMPAGKVVEAYPYGFGVLSATGFRERLADRPGHQESSVLRMREAAGFVRAGRRERKGALRCCICVETCPCVVVMERLFSAP